MGILPVDYKQRLIWEGGCEGEKGEEMPIVKVQSNGTELKCFGASFLLFLLIYPSI